ncbi:MAG: transcriptional regulator [Ignavibacteria bacterium]|nr:transcriptional regulator [Ignavibacteria bacterium]
MCQQKKSKRSLFKEIAEGIDALKHEREGKITLRRHVLVEHDVPTISPDELVAIRTNLRLSQPVFAAYLRTNARTLENWEQGRAKPNTQAALLILMVRKYPDTIKRLSQL